MNELGEAFPAVLATAAAGDPEAFAGAWPTAHPPLLRYLSVKPGDGAEDVTSGSRLPLSGALPPTRAESHG